jgi:uncharacterized protein (UPF0212 family)
MYKAEGLCILYPRLREHTTTAEEIMMTKTNTDSMAAEIHDYIEHCSEADLLRVFAALISNDAEEDDMFKIFDSGDEICPECGAKMHLHLVDGPNSLRIGYNECPNCELSRVAYMF